MSIKRSNPADFLKQVLGRVVTVKLHDQTSYVGILACLDGNMNIVLEQAEEQINGQSDQKTKFGQLFIRGNNVYYLSAKTQNKKK